MPGRARSVHYQIIFSVIHPKDPSLDNGLIQRYGPLTRYEKFQVAHAPGMPGTFSRHWLQRKPFVSDPDMHHASASCMSESLTRGCEETFSAFPAHAQPTIVCIWQEADGLLLRPFDYQINYMRRTLWLFIVLYHYVCRAFALDLYSDLYSDSIVDW